MAPTSPCPLQVHGHDFSCIATIPTPAPPPTGSAGASDGGAAAASAPTATTSCPTAAAVSGAAMPRMMYASGSEEKVLRLLEAPSAFVDTLAMARGQQASSGGRSSSRGGGAGGGAAFGAALPALGLSNKALYAPVTEAEAAGGLRAGRHGAGATWLWGVAGGREGSCLCATA